MTDQFVEIDDSGWGDLIASTVIVCRTHDDRRSFRVLEMAHFQEDFPKQTYLNRTYEVILDMLEELSITNEYEFRMCEGYVLKTAREKLMEDGFNVVLTKIKGETQNYAESRFNDILHRLKCSRNQDLMRRWLKEDEPNRRKYAKTGWKSYKRIALG